jgi:hypothetical protein
VPKDAIADHEKSGKAALAADPEAVIRMAGEAVVRPWDISAEQRARIVERLGQIAESESPLVAIKVALVYLKMDQANRAAAELLDWLDERDGPLENALDALASGPDEPEEPAIRAMAS